jgi:hypothetical protein
MWHTNISGSIEEIVLSFRNFQFGFSWVFGQSVSNQCVFNHVKCLGKANVADAALTEHLIAFVLFSTFLFSGTGRQIMRSRQCSHSVCSDTGSIELFIIASKVVVSMKLSFSKESLCI